MVSSLKKLPGARDNVSQALVVIVESHGGGVKRVWDMSFVTHPIVHALVYSKKSLVGLKMRKKNLPVAQETSMLTSLGPFFATRHSRPSSWCWCCSLLFVVVVLRW